MSSEGALCRWFLAAAEARLGLVRLARAIGAEGGEACARTWEGARAGSAKPFDLLGRSVMYALAGFSFGTQHAQVDTADNSKLYTRR